MATPHDLNTPTPGSSGATLKHPAPTPPSPNKIARAVQAAYNIVDVNLSAINTLLRLKPSAIERASEALRPATDDFVARMNALQFTADDFLPEEAKSTATAGAGDPAPTQPSAEVLERMEAARVLLEANRPILAVEQLIGRVDQSPILDTLSRKAKRRLLRVSPGGTPSGVPIHHSPPRGNTPTGTGGGPTQGDTATAPVTESTTQDNQPAAQDAPPPAPPAPPAPVPADWQSEGVLSGSETNSETGGRRVARRPSTNQERRARSADDPDRDRSGWPSDYSSGVSSIFQLLDDNGQPQRDGHGRRRYVRRRRARTDAERLAERDRRAAHKQAKIDAGDPDEWSSDGTEDEVTPAQPDSDNPPGQRRRHTYDQVRDLLRERHAVNLPQRLRQLNDTESQQALKTLTERRDRRRQVDLKAKRAEKKKGLAYDRKRNLSQIDNKRLGPGHTLAFPIFAQEAFKLLLNPVQEDLVNVVNNYRWLGLARISGDSDIPPTDDTLGFGTFLEANARLKDNGRAYTFQDQLGAPTNFPTVEEIRRVASEARKQLVVDAQEGIINHAVARFNEMLAYRSVINLSNAIRLEWEDFLDATVWYHPSDPDTAINVTNFFGRDTAQLKEYKQVGQRREFSGPAALRRVTNRHLYAATLGRKQGKDYPAWKDEYDALDEQGQADFNRRYKEFRQRVDKGTPKRPRHESCIHFRQGWDGAVKASGYLNAQRNTTLAGELIRGQSYESVRAWAGEAFFLVFLTLTKPGTCPDWLYKQLKTPSFVWQMLHQMSELGEGTDAEIKTRLVGPEAGKNWGAWTYLGLRNLRAATETVSLLIDVTSIVDALHGLPPPSQPKQVKGAPPPEPYVRLDEAEGVRRLVGLLPDGPIIPPADGGTEPHLTALPLRTTPLHPLQPLYPVYRAEDTVSVERGIEYKKSRYRLGPSHIEYLRCQVRPMPGDEYTINSIPVTGGRGYIDPELFTPSTV